MAEPIIELKNVSFSAQSESIVRDISLQCREGQCLALAGPSGGGKSTALKLASGLLVPSGGTVLFRGRDIAAMNRVQNLEFRREAAMVFQDSALWANQNLDQILDIPLRLHFPQMNAAARMVRIREVCAEVGYRRDLAFRPAKLSMGEQKLIAFARALLCHPVLLFLDEWTESLDDDAAQHLVGIVRRFKRAGHTVIFVSHDLRLIKSLADDIVMISEGRVSLRLTGAQFAENEAVLAEQIVEKETADAL
jgi:ABC-type multidrug transport system ATPase subunit